MQTAVTSGPKEPNPVTEDSGLSLAEVRLDWGVIGFFGDTDIEDLDDNRFAIEDTLGNELASPLFHVYSAGEVTPDWTLGLTQVDNLVFIDLALPDGTAVIVESGLATMTRTQYLTTVDGQNDFPNECGWEFVVNPGGPMHAIAVCIGPLCVEELITGDLLIPHRRRLRRRRPVLSPGRSGV